MVKLIETPEAQAYPEEMRAKVVQISGVQMLLEWRFWLVLLGLSAIAGAIFGSLGDHRGVLWTYLIRFSVALPVGLLGARICISLRRWILRNRRANLLHAIGAPSTPGPAKR